nr:EOG090X0EI4 [Sida crystallina]
MMLRRFFHRPSFTALYSSEKSNASSLLATLRKKTGYSISNCKKALTISGNDIGKAETWLEEQAQAQGWDKAAKLQNRATLQGLIGIAHNDTTAAMVEVNCETDFVARNEKFQTLVTNIASVCLENVHLVENSPVYQVKFSSDQLGAMTSSAPGSTKLSDLVALNIGQIGENMNLRRASALGFNTNQIKLACCTHPMQTVGETVMLGKYGAVITYQVIRDGGSDPVELPEEITLDKLPRQLCQHIIVRMSVSSYSPFNNDSKASESTRLLIQRMTFDSTKMVRYLLQGNTGCNCSKVRKWLRKANMSLYPRGMNDLLLLLLVSLVTALSTPTPIVPRATLLPTPSVLVP